MAAAGNLTSETGFNSTTGFDYSDHSDFSDKLRKINVTFITTTAVILALRIGVRLFLIRTIGLDDGKIR